MIAPHLGWELRSDDYQDSDGFWRVWYDAHHPEHGHRLLQVSDFTFNMTQDRFNWLVENGFPSPPGKGPWSNKEIDERIANAPGS